MRHGCEKILTGSAANAFLRHRIYGQSFIGNDLSALDAPAIVAFCQTPLGHFDAHKIAFAGALLGFGHRLLLHCIHPRQPADGLLIKRHRGAGLLAQRRHAFEIKLLFIKPPACRFQIRFHHVILDQPVLQYK